MKMLQLNKMDTADPNQQDAKKVLESEPTDEIGDFDATIESTISENDVLPGTSNAANEGDVPTCKPPSGEKKRRLTGKQVSEEDKAIAVMGQYFAKKLTPEKVKPSPAVKSDLQTEDDMFCQMLSTEMKQITAATLKRNLKRKLLDTVYSTQEMQEQQEFRDAQQALRNEAQQQNPFQLVNWVMCENESLVDENSVSLSGQPQEHYLCVPETKSRTLSRSS